MVYYIPVKVTINTLSLAEMIINMVGGHYGVLESIVIDQSSLFISKFWSLLCYLLGIKKNYLQPFTLKQMVRQRGKIA